MTELPKRFEAARIYLCANQPFFGTLVLNLRLQDPHPSVPTAGVTEDGSVYFNPEFSDTLSDSEFRAVLLHEVLHVAFDVFGRQGTKVMRLWNAAHDYVINQMIEDINDRYIGLPKDCLLDQKYRGWSADEVYEDLISKRHEQDRRDPMEGDCRPDLGGSTPTGQRAAQGDESARNELRQGWKERLAEAREVAKNQGKMPDHMKELVEKFLNPTVPWQQLLARFLGSTIGPPDQTYSRRSRRQSAVGSDFVLPGTMKMTGADVTILWDTSGSMYGEAPYILGEVSGICDDAGYSARLIVCDAAVHYDGTIEDADDCLDKLHGGGGSDFRPAFRLIEKDAEPTVVIAFTDGYISVPDTMPHVVEGCIWGITSGGQPPASWGEVVNINKRK